MIYSFANAQQVVIENFETPANYTYAGFEGLGSASIAADPASGGTRGNGMKLVSVSSGKGWQGGEVIFAASKVSLRTDKTITVDVYSTQAFTMMGKAEQGGTAPVSATSANYTTPNTWQKLTFTFNTSSDGTGIANGDYSKIAFFPNRNSSNNGWATPSNFTVHLDNITGVKIVATPDAVPTTAAPTPPIRNAVDVKSIYSNAYTPIGVLGYSGNVDSYNTSWCGGATTEVMIAGNSTNKITGLGCEGINFKTVRFNATTMTNLHIDIWTDTPTLDKSFNIKFSNWGGGDGEANAIQFSTTNASTPSLPKANPGSWISLDIPLTSMPGLRTDLVEFVITSDLGTVYYDNLYLWKEPAPAGTPTISFAIPAKNISDAPFSLTSPIITSNSAGAISFTSSNTSVATISGSTVTIVGIGTTTITANQIANGNYIATSATTILDVNPAAAPAPQTNPATVIALYGETYPITGYLEGFGGVITVDLDPTAEVNNALKIDFNNAGYGQGFSTKDVSGMQFVHFDYYTTDATTFRLYLMSGTPTHEAIYNVPGIVKNEWVSVNIPMSYFTNTNGFKAAEFFQFKFDTAGATPGTVYFDNLYFTSSSLGTTKFEKSNLKVYPNPATSNITIESNSAIERVSVYNILGQEVLSKSPKANNTTLDISNLQKGTYLVKTTSEGKTETTKVIKK